MPDLLTNQTTDTESTPIAWSGGAGTLFVRGTIRRPTQVVMQIEKHGQWNSANARLTLSHEGQEDFLLGENCSIRAKLINAQADSNVSVSIEAA